MLAWAMGLEYTGTLTLYKPQTYKKLFFKTLHMSTHLHMRMRIHTQMWFDKAGRSKNWNLSNTQTTWLSQAPWWQYDLSGILNQLHKHTEMTAISIASLIEKKVWMWFHCLLVVCEL